jgi:hypothetical protein
MELIRYNNNEENHGLVKAVGAGELVNALQRNEIIETSAFVGPAASDLDVALFVKKLGELTEMNKAQIAYIGNQVRIEGWTKQKLNYAIDQVLHFEYPRPAPGKILNIDKKITLGRSEVALRRNLKFTITQNEIVVVKIERKYEDNGKIKYDYIRAYAYKYEAEDIMPDNIIGRWNDTEHCFDYSETFYNHEAEARQLEFKKKVLVYCDYPPRYNGKYSLDIVKRFFSYWGEIIPPGDMMRYERRMVFNIEDALESFNKKFNNQN